MRWSFVFYFYTVFAVVAIYSHFCNGESHKASSSAQLAWDVLEDIGKFDNRKTAILHTLKKYTEWAMREESIVRILTKRLELLTDEMNLIKRYLNNYEKSTGQAIKNARVSVDTPEDRGRIVGKSAVLGHQMTHRYVTELSQLRNLYNSTEYKGNYRQIEVTLSMAENAPWINYLDTYFSMTTYIHLGEVYLYQPEHMWKGVEIDTQAGGNLSPLHCAEIGVYALYRKRNAISVEWLELAESMLEKPSIFPSQKGEETSSLTIDLARMLTRVAIQEHNNIVSSSEESNKSYDAFVNLYLGPIINRANPRRSRRKYEFLRTRGFTREHDVVKQNSQYSELCVGKTLQPPEISKDLRCYYENKNHPYLFISPVKTEQLSKEPPVLQFYEVIGSQASEIIQRKNDRIVETSKVTGGSGDDYQTTWRTSAGVGIPPDHMPKGVYILAEFLTGLKIIYNSDLTQYAEYTYGRFYTQHSDTFHGAPDTSEYIQITGDRIATMLYYLELPDMGGLTPFCQAGVSAYAEKGSAVFWYNMYRNGTVRNDVSHGACPVLHGNKIIMNHWVHYYGNWQNWRCSLNQFE